MIDLSNNAAYESLLARLFNLFHSPKTKLNKKAIGVGVFDKFYSELVMLDAESLIVQTRFMEALKKLDDFKEHEMYSRFSDNSLDYLDNSLSKMKQQI